MCVCSIYVFGDMLSGCDYYPEDESSLIWEYTAFFSVGGQWCKGYFFILVFKCPMKLLDWLQYCQTIFTHALLFLSRKWVIKYVCLLKRKTTFRQWYTKLNKKNVMYNKLSVSPLGGWNYDMIQIFLVLSLLTPCCSIRNGRHSCITLQFSCPCNRNICSLFTWTQNITVAQHRFCLISKGWRFLGEFYGLLNSVSVFSVSLPS